CSAAVAVGERLLAAETAALRHGHAEALLPMIDRVMARAGRRPAQLDAVAAAVGPGGFTGIRVGLAAASGIALATGVRLLGVTSFAAVAAHLAAWDGWTLVALDSRREDLYAQMLAPDGGAAAPEALLPGALAARVAGRAPLRIAGDAAAAAAAALAGHAAC